MVSEMHVVRGAMKKLTGILGLSLAMAIGVPAWAQSSGAAPSAPRVYSASPWALSQPAPPRLRAVDGSFGLSMGYLRRFITPRDWETLKLGLDLRVRYEMAQAGVLLEVTAPLGWGNVNSAAVMLGVVFTPGPLRIDLLGVAGLHWYNGAGGVDRLIGDDEPGINATIPFIGGRIGLSVEWGALRRNGFGVQLLMDTDLERFESTYSFTLVTCERNCPQVPPTATTTRTVAFGEVHLGVLARYHWRF